MTISDKSKFVGVSRINPFESIPTMIDIENVTENCAFLTGISCAGVAGKYTYAQLYNPSGSGIIGYVTQVSYNAYPTVGNYYYRIGGYNVALANLLSTGINKNIGQAAGKCELRYGNSATSFGDTMIYEFRSNVYVHGVWRFKTPIRLIEGQSIIMSPANFNQALIGWFSWLELPT